MLEARHRRNIGFPTITEESTIRASISSNNKEVVTSLLLQCPRM